MHLRKAPNEPLNDFHNCFIHFCYNFFEDDIDWNFVKDKFEFIIHISMNPKEYESFESPPTYMEYGAYKSVTNEVFVPIESSSSSYQTTPATQGEVGELESPSIDIPSIFYHKFGL